MGALLAFLNASPARIQGLAIAALGMAAVIAALSAVALWYRAEAYQARAQRDVAVAQVDVVSAAAKACSSSVALARKAGDASLAIARGLLAEARRLHAGDQVMVGRIEALLERPTPPGAGCDQAWAELEQLRRKAGAPAVEQ